MSGCAISVRLALLLVEKAGRDKVVERRLESFLGVVEEGLEPVPAGGSEGARRVFKAIKDS